MNRFPSHVSRRQCTLLALALPFLSPSHAQPGSAESPPPLERAIEAALAFLNRMDAGDDEVVRQLADRLLEMCVQQFVRPTLAPELAEKIRPQVRKDCEAKPMLMHAFPTHVQRRRARGTISNSRVISAEDMAQQGRIFNVRIESETSTKVFHRGTAYSSSLATVTVSKDSPGEFVVIRIVVEY